MPKSLHSPWLTGAYGQREAVAAAAVTALKTSNIDFWFREFTSADHGMTAGVTGTGTATLAVTGETSGIGWAKMSTGATASSSAGWSDVDNCIQQPTKPWFVAGRFRLLTTPAAGTQMNFALRDAGSGARYGAGVDKAFVANNFSILIGASGVDTAVPFDLTYHTFQIWGLGGTSAFWTFDNSAATPATLSFSQTGAANRYLVGLNGATAADQTAITDWFAVASGYLP